MTNRHSQERKPRYNELRDLPCCSYWACGKRVNARKGTPRLMPHGYLTDTASVGDL